ASRPGCPNSTSNVTVTMTNDAFADIAGSKDTSICAGSPLQLHGSGGGSYSWLPETGLSNAGVFNPVATPSTTTTYTMTTTSNCGTARDTIIIRIKPLPVAAVGNRNLSICDSADAYLGLEPKSGYTY